MEEEDGQGGGNGDGGGGGDVGRGDSPIPIPMLLPTAVPIRIAIPMEPGGPGVGEWAEKARLRVKGRAGGTLKLREGDREDNGSGSGRALTRLVNAYAEA